MGHPDAEPPVVYIAAPLFCQSERRWNRELAREIEGRMRCTVVLPQDFKAPGEKDAGAHFAAIFRRCIEGVEAADAVVAVLDGSDADSGTAFEMGYAYALGKPVVGLRTDYREQHDQGTNLMCSRCCRAFVRVAAFDDDLCALAARIVSALGEALG
ncbi:MAG: nucleoside 2-deoxyribosyltransferase [Candidatus Brocadiia bacterium]